MPESRLEGISDQVMCVFQSTPWTVVVEKQPEELVTALSLLSNLMFGDFSIPIRCWCYAVTCAGKGCLPLGFCVVGWYKCPAVLRTFVMCLRPFLLRKYSYAQKLQAPSWNWVILKCNGSKICQSCLIPLWWSQALKLFYISALKCVRGSKGILLLFVLHFAPFSSKLCFFLGEFHHRSSPGLACLAPLILLLPNTALWGSGLGFSLHPCDQ